MCLVYEIYICLIIFHVFNDFYLTFNTPLKNLVVSVYFYKKCLVLIWLFFVCCIVFDDFPLSLPKYFFYFLVFHYLYKYIYLYIRKYLVSTFFVCITIVLLWLICKKRNMVFCIVKKIFWNSSALAGTFFCFYLVVNRWCKNRTWLDFSL